MSMMQKRSAMILGGFVADSAALGLHWLYDMERIAEISNMQPEFMPPNPENYEGTKGVFVHHGKQIGDLSHYGEMARLMLQTLVDGSNGDGSNGDGANEGGQKPPHDDFTVRDYMNNFKKSFGPGGTWVGYVDKPTSATLRRYDDYLADTAYRTDTGEDYPICGADDMQLPAVSRLFVLLGLVGVNSPDMTAKIERCIGLTNDNEWALAWGHTVSALQMAVLLTDDVDVILQAAVNASPRDLHATILESSRNTQAHVTQIANDFGNACLLSQGIPVCLHILRKANSYTDAIRMNILAGGDSCGRAMVIGPLAGALFGVGGENGIPLPWISKLKCNSDIMAYIEKGIKP